MDHRRRPSSRRGFTLLEVMIALSILVVSLVVLVETQATAAQMTVEAERMITATQLAQEKMAEVQTLMEYEGFSDQDIYEEGEFDDFGDEAVDLEFKGLSDYHYEYLVTEIDLGLAGDLTGTMANLSEAIGPGADGVMPELPDLSAFGVSEDAIIEMLQPFIREARVRVWWGEDLEEAEELGNEVVITTHIINPQGNMLGAAGLGGGIPGAGGAGSRGRPGRANGGGTPNRNNPFGGGGGR